VAVIAQGQPLLEVSWECLKPTEVLGPLRSIQPLKSDGLGSPVVPIALPEARKLGRSDWVIKLATERVEGGSWLVF